MSAEGTPSKFYKKWWFWLGVVVVLIALGRAGGGKGTESSAASTASETSQASEQAKPEVSVTASDYYDEYESNEVAADNKYKGKLLQITGRVSGVRKTLGSVYIDLESSNPYLFVACEMSDESAAASVSKGSQVTIIGSGAGKVVYPQLEDCQLAK
jgi:hypothetical protein